MEEVAEHQSVSELQRQISDLQIQLADLIAQLTQLGELQARGVLTAEEFAAAKARLLGL
jgi:hypothetical protein